MKKIIPGSWKITHGHWRNGRASPTWLSWFNMKQRCWNPNSRSYKNYGARGIKVCKRWHKFENFLKDMGERPEGLTLERKNNDGGYAKKNCRWATRKEQAFNRRITPRKATTCLIVEGVTLTIMEWAALSGEKYQTIKTRRHRGWSSKEAVYGR